MKKMLTCLCSIVLSYSVCAQIILAVDFNTDQHDVGIFSPTESGFKPFNVDFTSNLSKYTMSYNIDSVYSDSKITITVQSDNGNLLTRDRLGLRSPLEDLFRDFIAPANDGAHLIIQIDGLSPKSIYKFVFLTYDNDSNVQSDISTDIYLNTTGGSQPFADHNIVRYGGGFQDPQDYQVILYAISTETGHASFEVEAMSGSKQGAPDLNALIIEIPEPYSAFVTSVLCIFLYTRQKYNRGGKDEKTKTG